METVTRINGNGQEYTTTLPKLFILGPMNDVALRHITANTGLEFTPLRGGFEAQPTASHQIAALLMTYDYKTQYYDNWNYKNTLMLKNDHHIGFDVDSICYDCCKHNRIHVGGLKAGDRLAC